MRPLLMIAALVLVPALAEAADWHVGVRTDNGRIIIGSDGVRGHIRIPADRRDSVFDRRDRRDKHHRRDRWRPWYLNRYYVVTPPPDKAEPVEVPPQNAEPPAKEVPKEEVPPAAEGSNARYRARGAAPAPEWEVGQVLPSDVPHVKLDAAAYGLPALPDDRIYARVRTHVLVIDAVTRRIEEIIRN